MNFNEAFEVPVTETIGGTDQQFPLLEIDDYLQWCSELTTEKRKAASVKIPKTVTGPNGLPQIVDQKTRWEMECAIDNIEVGLLSIADLIWVSVPAAKRVLMLSLGKTGLDANGCAKVVRRVPPGRLHSLAAEVSGLFAKKINGDGSAKLPNPQTPAANESIAGEISSSTESK